MNFNNTFSENLIHNMIEVKFTIKKVKDEWEQIVGIWVEVFFIPWLNPQAPPTSAMFHIFGQNLR